MLFIPSWGWPHSDRDNLEDTLAIKLRQNTTVNLLVLILYSSSAFHNSHLIGLCGSKKDAVPFLALILNMWQASWMLKRISKMTFESRKSGKLIVSDTDLQSLPYYFHWLHFWFDSTSMNEVVISYSEGIVTLSLKAKRHKLMLIREN